MAVLVLYPLLILLLLQVKHLVIDFLWQPPFEFRNKGAFGHWGGIRHALKQAVGTFLCFAGPFLALGVGKAWLPLVVAALDFVLHYLVDWSKMNLNRAMGVGPADEKFWWLLGLDQFAHQLTYLGLVALVVLV